MMYPAATSDYFTVLRRDGPARRATLRLAHGVVETPTFMPVGTAATVKALAPDTLYELGAEIILANTYHLTLRPGRDIIEALGGLNRFMSWDRPILTDSGGFQIFSLETRREVSERGVRFRSHLDGREHEFTPESVVAFQEGIGVDIAMCLDICVKLPASSSELSQAVALTTRWAERSLTAKRRTKMMLFGIVQGGLDARLRAESARGLLALDFPGYAIGGLSVGESREDMYRVARSTAAMLPEDRPRYLMGVGTVRDLIVGVDAGIDLFDCVYPTRCGRNGRAMTLSGDLNIRNAVFTRDPRPVDPDCRCKVCRKFSRAYLAHLFRAEEMLGPQLLSYHNLYVLLELMKHARLAIEHGQWNDFRQETLAKADTVTVD